MKNTFVLTNLKNKTVGLLLEEDKPVELRVYDENSKLGNIYVGKVSNVVQNINAAFVDIEKGITCYMPLEDCGAPVKIGDELPVQFSKEAVKSKQPTVTPKLSLTGRYVVLSLFSTIGVSSKIKDAKRRGELKEALSDTLSKLCDIYLEKDMPKGEREMLRSIGGIVRTQAEGADLQDICHEVNVLFDKLITIIRQSQYATLYSCLHRTNAAFLTDALSFFYREDTRVLTDRKEIADKVQAETQGDSILYDDKICPLSALYNLNKVVEKAQSKLAYLKSGAYLVIEPTEAMTVIDVNTGKAIKGKDSEAAFLKINMEAAHEIGRQLRLRNISGIIMVDFINMKEAQNNILLLQELKSVVERDPIQTTVVDMTELGLVEITRKKIRKPLYELFRA